MTKSEVAKIRRIGNRALEVENPEYGLQAKVSVEWVTEAGAASLLVGGGTEPECTKVRVALEAAGYTVVETIWQFLVSK